MLSRGRKRATRTEVLPSLRVQPSSAKRGLRYDLKMRFWPFNFAQRVVLVIGLGVGLFFFGGWVTTLEEVRPGWVAYAPLTRAAFFPDLRETGLHPWVRLVIWLILLALWVGAAVFLLRTRGPKKVSNSST